MYELIEDAPLVAWIRSRFPVTRWGRIDWDNVEERECVSDEDIESPEVWLSRLGLKHGLGEAPVAVRTADFRSPSLRLQYSELVRHVDLIIVHAWDAWILDEQSDWIMERYHEGEWCWGRCPPPVTGEHD